MSLLRNDVEFEMPPHLLWFVGQDAVAGFLRSRVLTQPGDGRMVQTVANDQPGQAAYRRQPDEASSCTVSRCSA